MKNVFVTVISSFDATRSGILGDSSSSDSFPLVTLDTPALFGLKKLEFSYFFALPPGIGSALLPTFFSPFVGDDMLLSVQASSVPLLPLRRLSGCEPDMMYPDGRRERVVEMPSLEVTMRMRGRRVAREPAVMARPCSTVLQMAMSRVAQRKSGSENLWRKARRTTTAEEALGRRQSSRSRKG